MTIWCLRHITNLKSPSKWAWTGETAQLTISGLLHSLNYLSDFHRIPGVQKHHYLTTPFTNQPNLGAPTCDVKESHRGEARNVWPFCGILCLKGLTWLLVNWWRSRPDWETSHDWSFLVTETVQLVIWFVWKQGTSKTHGLSLSSIIFLINVQFSGSPVLQTNPLCERIAIHAHRNHSISHYQSHYLRCYTQLDGCWWFQLWSFSPNKWASSPVDCWSKPTDTILGTKISLDWSMWYPQNSMVHSLFPRFRQI